MEKRLIYMMTDFGLFFPVEGEAAGIVVDPGTRLLADWAVRDVG